MNYRVIQKTNTYTIVEKETGHTLASGNEKAMRQYCRF